MSFWDRMKNDRSSPSKSNLLQKSRKGNNEIIENTEGDVNTYKANRMTVINNFYVFDSMETITQKNISYNNYLVDDSPSTNQSSEQESAWAECIQAVVDLGNTVDYINAKQKYLSPRKQFGNKSLGYMLDFCFH